MSDDAHECSCVVDCGGLHEIATTKSNNLKSFYLDRLEKGVIAVPAVVWKEFQELYEDEAAALASHVSTKVIMKRAYYVGAARIAEKLNSGFSRGAYDAQTDLYAASIATTQGYKLLTSSSHVGEYKGVECEVLDLQTWAEEQGD